MISQYPKKPTHIPQTWMLNLDDYLNLLSSLTWWSFPSGPQCPYTYCLFFFLSCTPLHFCLEWVFGVSFALFVMVFFLFYHVHPQPLCQLWVLDIQTEVVIMDRRCSSQYLPGARNLSSPSTWDSLYVHSLFSESDSNLSLGLFPPQLSKEKGYKRGKNFQIFTCWILWVQKTRWQ